MGVIEDAAARMPSFVVPPSPERLAESRHSDLMEFMERRHAEDVEAQKRAWRLSFASLVVAALSLAVAAASLVVAIVR